MNKRLRVKFSFGRCDFDLKMRELCDRHNLRENKCFIGHIIKNRPICPIITWREPQNRRSIIVI